MAAHDGGRVYMVNRRTTPARFDYSRVRVPPNADMILAMCERQPWSATTKKKARDYLPYMLQGKFYSEGGASMYLAPFSAGDDPYAYYHYCRQLETTYPGIKQAGSWLKSVARLLICWVAEELRAQGHGAGFADHFVVRGASIRAVPMAAPTKDIDVDASYGDDLRAYYDAEVTGCDSSVLASGGADAPYPRHVASPPYVVQSSRTCMLIPPLVAFLRTGGTTKRQRVDYTRLEGKAVFEQIRHWVRHTEAGHRHAREHADIDPDGFHVDHVIPEAMGGPTHYFNAHLMPSSHNSHFRDWWTAEKRDYVGEHAVRAARSVTEWGRQRVDWNMFNGR